MKNIFLTIISLILFLSVVRGQQPLLNENYFVNKYALSPAYAGNSENNSVFTSYRRDWSGVSGSPQTISLSYHDSFKSKVGFGVKIIMDKIGIFQNFYGLTTYTYKLDSDKDQILFGLSAGVNQNSINFSDYYNDPSFNSDPAMTNRDLTSKLKFISDVSLVYIRNNLQSGFLFSNINFGDYSYSNATTTYNPFINYQFHVIYKFVLNESLTLIPLVIYRGGKNIKGQSEFASQLRFNNKLWGSLALRGKNIFCLGFGFNVSKEILVNYAYNFSTGVSVRSSFQNHELTVGVNLSAFSKKGKELSMK